MVNSDSVLRAITDDGAFRVITVDTTATVRLAIEAQKPATHDLARTFSDLYRLSASQTAFLVAVPVLLGSLARLPMGMLTDRYGGPAFLLQQWQHDGKRILIVRRIE